MKHETQTPDWAAMIEQLTKKGLTLKQIGAAMSTELTERMVRHFAIGVQPLPHRARALTDLWCLKMKRKPEHIPMREGAGQVSRPTEFRRARLHSPPWADLIAEILESGITIRELAQRLDIVSMSDKLLKHYADGGQPNFPRGDAILNLWAEVTGKSPAFVRMIDWSAPHRAGNTAMVLHERCKTCGQIMRGSRLATWRQMDLHKAEHGGLPNWPACATKTEAEA